MGTAAKPTRENRTITLDFRDEAPSFQLLGEGKAFLEGVLAFILSLGFQFKHKMTCTGWAHYLAAPLHRVSRRVHGPPPLRLALSSDATGGRS